MNSINNTLFVGKVLNHFDELPSTNLLALEMLANERITEGVVISTFHQTAGRGQMGNRWESHPNQNISVSIVLLPTFIQAREQFHLNKAIALAVADFVSLFTEGVAVKWANDIYVGDKKVAGILIQNTLSGDTIQSSVVGIGVNVNQTVFPNLPNASSLKLASSASLDLPTALEKLLKCVEARYLQLKTRKFDDLHVEYLSKMFRFGEDFIFQYPNEIYFSGKIVGVTDAGQLTVMTKQGMENFDIKEIKFVI